MAALLWEKVVRPGRAMMPDGRNGDVFVAIRYYQGEPGDSGHCGRLSFVGVEGPRTNGNARGSCGQIPRPNFTTFARGWDEAKAARLWELWERWHMNDLRPHCPHVDPEAGKQVLTLRPLRWGAVFHRKLVEASHGTMPADEYATWAEIVDTVHKLTVHTRSPQCPEAWGPVGERYLQLGLVKLGDEETRPAGWVYPEEHPQGMLGRECPVCGQRYGYGWWCEPVPGHILDEILALPDADRAPAWI